MVQVNSIPQSTDVGSFQIVTGPKVTPKTFVETLVREYKELGGHQKILQNDLFKPGEYQSLQITWGNRLSVVNPMPDQPRAYSQVVHHINHLVLTKDGLKVAEMLTPKDTGETHTRLRDLKIKDLLTLALVTTYDHIMAQAGCIISARKPDFLSNLYVHKPLE